MLYDNSQLARVYLHAWQVTGNEFFRTITEEILDYVVREMTDSAEGFYSTQDADSEGEEGKFFVWTPDEIRQVLANDSALSQRQLPHQGVLISYKVVFDWFQVQLDGFADVPHGLINRVPFADTTRQSGHIDRITALIAWFKHHLELHFSPPHSGRHCSNSSYSIVPILTLCVKPRYFAPSGLRRAKGYSCQAKQSDLPSIALCAKMASLTS
jgi:hypothetical protein